MPARRKATTPICRRRPSYPGGWKFNREPDVVIKMPVEFTIEPRSEYPMLDFYVPMPWTDGMKLIQMSEARPSNKAVVHHITVSLVTFPPGTEVIDGQPFTTDASGKKVPLDRRTARITEQKLPTRSADSARARREAGSPELGRRIHDAAGLRGGPRLRRSSRRRRHAGAAGPVPQLQHALHADRPRRVGSIRSRACGSRRSR